MTPAVVSTREEYWAELRTLIQARMVFPEEARRRRQSGTVALTFEVAKAGYVRCITLDRSSGITVLDRAAIERSYAVSGPAGRATAYRPC